MDFFGSRLTAQFQNFIILFSQPQRNMSQAVFNYFNNFMSFDKDYKFEQWTEKTPTKNVSIVEFNGFKKIEEMKKLFEECGDAIKPEFKLNTIFPNVLDYKLRGILSIAQQFNLTDENIEQFLEYGTKQKEQPSLEVFKKRLLDYFTDNKMKIKVFNSVFPHGVHEKSQGKVKEDIKGVDMIYLQKIGSSFEAVLDAICKGKSEQEVYMIVKQQVFNKIKETLPKGSSKSFGQTISSINVEEMIELERIQTPTDEQKERKKQIKKIIDGYKDEVKKWVSDVISELTLTQRLMAVINEGLTYTGLERKHLSGYHKKYLEIITQINEVKNHKIESNNDLIEFSKFIIDLGNNIFGTGKGQLLLQDAKANVKTLLSKKDAKAFDEDQEIPQESIDKLFEAKAEQSKTKAILKVVNANSIPQNVKVALGIYVTNMFFEEVQKVCYNKNWEKRTIYVKL